MAIADLDTDGRLDLVISNNGAAPTIYLNDLVDTGNWLRIRLTGRSPGSNRDALGARVRVTFDDGGKERTLTRWVEAGSGYASQSALPVHFGLGNAQTIEKLEIDWPGGRQQQFKTADLNGLLNREIQVEEGSTLFQ